MDQHTAEQSVPSAEQPQPASHIPWEALHNLAHFHSEHEKFYSLAPIREAHEVLEASRTLHSLVETWQASRMANIDDPRVPYYGYPDLNDLTALETSGVLFMTGDTEPPELARMRATLRERAEAYVQTGRWLDDAMQSSWQAAEALLPVPQLADLLGERHRIIANNRLAAAMGSLAGQLLERAVQLLEQVDFAPDALRAALASGEAVQGYLHSAARLLDRAADLMVMSTTLTRDTAPAWRAWLDRVDSLGAEPIQPTAMGRPAAEPAAS